MMAASEEEAETVFTNVGGGGGASEPMAKAGARGVRLMAVRGSVGDGEKVEATCSTALFSSV
jgi:hypothetical protein